MSTTTESSTKAVPASLPAALAELQRRLPAIQKSETARVQSTKGSYSYSYADLATVTKQVMPLLGELGLSFVARPTYTPDGRFALAYSLLHVSGDREDGEYPLPAGGTPQAIGSAITYARRYCLCAITGVAPEEDDDDAAEAEAVARQGGQYAQRRQETRPPAQRHMQRANP